jgi:hypothetical protein
MTTTPSPIIIKIDTGERRTKTYTLFGQNEKIDWCHIFGNRTKPLIDLWYSQNAEHDLLLHNSNNEKKKDATANTTDKYVRICKGCCDQFVQVLKEAKEQEEEELSRESTHDYIRKNGRIKYLDDDNN